MNHYSYKAISADGQVLRGMMDGFDPASIQEKLTAKGFYVLHVKESGRLLRKVEDKFSSFRISRKDVIEFSSNMAIMLRAGVPLLSALEDIIKTMTNEYMKSAVLDVKRNTEMGIMFSEALNLQRTIFPDILIRLVKVGEETGRLDNSLSEVATHLQKLEDLAATVKRAMIYPLFSLITTGTAVIFWLAYVLPKIMQVIIGLDVKMPLLTKVLYEVSKVTERYWYVMIAIPVSIVLAIQIMKWKRSTRYYWDMVKIKLPIVKLLLFNRLLALFAEQMRLLIMAGITIDRAFDVSVDVIGNEVFKQAIMNVKADVIAGRRISDAMGKQQTIFPAIFVRMVSIGESSGNLDVQFGFLAEYYYKIVDDFSEKIGKMIEPILMITLGLLMGVMIAGVLLPMYDVFSKIR